MSNLRKFTCGFFLYKQFEILPQVIKNYKTAVKDVFYEMMKKQPH